MKKGFEYLGLLLFLPFWWMQRMVVRDPRIWVFGSWNGRRFSDNSRYLYLYVLQNQPNIRPIWLSRDMKHIEQIIELGGEAYSIRSLRGIFYSLKAKAIFVSSGKRDVNRLFINGAVRIHLWHGNPLKKIGLDDRFSAAHSLFYSLVVKQAFPMNYEFNYDYMVSNAPVFTPLMASSYNLPVESIWETGCPRNDVFKDVRENAFNHSLRKQYPDCRIVYYMPTFRDHSEAKTLFTLDDFNAGKLEKFLENENLVFISKGHYVDEQLTGKGEGQSSRIFHLSDSQVSDINFMLKDADLLVTDYSSAYFDFLLTGNPIIFAAFDLKRYMSGSRELYFNYETAIAGPIATSWNELFIHLRDIWDDPHWQALRTEKNALFNKYHDNQNSARVFARALSSLGSGK